MQDLRRSLGSHICDGGGGRVPGVGRGGGAGRGGAGSSGQCSAAIGCGLPGRSDLRLRWLRHRQLRLRRRRRHL